MAILRRDSCKMHHFFWMCAWRRPPARTPTTPRPLYVSYCRRASGGKATGGFARTPPAKDAAGECALQSLAHSDGAAARCEGNVRCCPRCLRIVGQFCLVICPRRTHGLPLRRCCVPPPPPPLPGRDARGRTFSFALCVCVPASTYAQGEMA